MNQLNITPKDGGPTRIVELVGGHHIYNSITWFDIIGKVEIGDTFTYTTHQCECCNYTETNKYRIESFYKSPSEETTRFTCRMLYGWSDKIVESKTNPITGGSTNSTTPLTGINHITLIDPL